MSWISVILTALLLLFCFLTISQLIQSLSWTQWIPLAPWYTSLSMRLHHATRSFLFFSERSAGTQTDHTLFMPKPLVRIRLIAALSTSNSPAKSRVDNLGSFSIKSSTYRAKSGVLMCRGRPELTASSRVKVSSRISATQRLTIRRLGVDVCLNTCWSSSWSWDTDLPILNPV